MAKKWLKFGWDWIIFRKTDFVGFDDERTDGQMDGPMPFIFKGLQKDGLTYLCANFGED